MRAIKWTRAAALAELRDRVWLYLTDACDRETDIELEAEALLQMRPREVRRLAEVHFALGPEVQALLAAMPRLVRRLARTTVDDQERSAERIRGPIQWGPTVSYQAMSGVRVVYVTAPARRAYETPENQVLVAALGAIEEVGKRSSWLGTGRGHLSSRILSNTAAAEEWLTIRALADVSRVEPTPRMLRRVTAGRAHRTYQPAVDVVVAHQRLIRALDRAAIQQAVEEYALATRDNDRLLELQCAFRMESELAKTGWAVSRPGLVKARRLFVARRDSVQLDIYFQTVPEPLAMDAEYEATLDTHGITAQPLRPDLVLHVRRGPRSRWVLVEIKGGPERTAAQSARAATFDLLAYRRSLDRGMRASPRPYGLGIAWGADLSPTPESQILLCTPDSIGAALDIITGAYSDQSAWEDGHVHTSAL
jgi:hypothetical protein